jgi:hypothetical protein
MTATTTASMVVITDERALPIFVVCAPLAGSNRPGCRSLPPAKKEDRRHGYP